MKAAVFHGINDLRVEILDKPVINTDEVLVKIAYAGICGSDLHIVNNGMFITKIPQILGHEFSGVVESVGSNVKDLAIGTPVIGDPRVYCGACHWCQIEKGNLCSDLGFIGEVVPGSFAEYMAIKASKLLALPAEVDLKKACLTEPVAVGVRIAEQGGFSKLSNLGIIGAGPIGLITAVLAKEVYLVQNISIIDVAEQRLEIARRLGIESVYKSRPESISVDIVVEAAGAETAFKEALEWVEPEGRVVIVGIYEDNISIAPNQILTKELCVTGIHGYQFKDLEEALTIVAEDKLSLTPMVSVMPLEQINEALELLLDSDKTVAKVLLTFS